MKQNYHLLDPHEFERAEEHQNTLTTEDEETIRNINQWFDENGYLIPVFYVVRIHDGKEIKSVIDGWKKVIHAKVNGIDKILAYEIQTEGEDLIKVMIQLQNSGHNSLMALYHMIKVLHSKHYKGQGKRTDLFNEEYEKKYVSKSGRKLNHWERIGVDLGIRSGNKIKYIYTVGEVNPLHFERIENSRFTLYQAYSECKRELEDYEPPVPKAKSPIYHSDTTEPPEFESVDSTDENKVSVETGNSSHNPSNENKQKVDQSIKDQSLIPTDLGNVEATITIRGYCTCCKKETEVIVNSNTIINDQNE